MGFNFSSCVKIVLVNSVSHQGKIYMSSKCRKTEGRGVWLSIYSHENMYDNIIGVCTKDPRQRDDPTCPY